MLRRNDDFCILEIPRGLRAESFSGRKSPFIGRAERLHEQFQGIVYCRS